MVYLMLQKSVSSGFMDSGGKSTLCTLKSDSEIYFYSLDTESIPQ